MAPALTDSLPVAPKLDAPLDIFPDGLRTTGQHAPLYEHIRPFDRFPREITGPTVWKAEDYRENPEKWTHRFTPEQIAELSTAADAFLASKTPLTGISKVSERTAEANHPCPATELTLYNAEQLPPPKFRRLPRDPPSRHHRWKRFHPIQGLPSRRMGKSQICRRIHGSGYIPWLLRQSK